MDFENLAVAMGELDEDTVKEILESVDSVQAANAAMEACQKGMDTVGKLFEEGEYFVGDLIYAGELMTDAVEVLKPYLAGAETSGAKTRMILCTVKDDLHDIGKNLVVMMVESTGYEVIDLGIDVPVEKFIAAASEEGVKIVACSALLTTTMPAMRETVAALNKHPRRGEFKIMVGGAPITEAFAEEIGADVYTEDAASAGQAAKALAGK